MKKLFLMTTLMLSSLSFANNPFNVKIKTFEGKQTLTNYSMCEGTLTLISTNTGVFSSKTYFLSGPPTTEKLWLFINGTDSYTVVQNNSYIDVDDVWFNPITMQNEAVYAISVQIYQTWNTRICYADQHLP